MAFVLWSFFKISFVQKDGWTSLYSAAFNGFEEIVKILIENGANIHLPDNVLIFFLNFFYL